MPVWLLGMSRFSKEEDRMAKIMLVMTHEEVDTNIAYSLICFSRYGSAWDTGRRRRAWLANFAEEERRAACRLFKQARGWTLGRGITFDDIITQVHCNCRNITPDAVRKEVDDLLKLRLADMRELLERNIDKIAEEARKGRE